MTEAAERALQGTRGLRWAVLALLFLVLLTAYLARLLWANAATYVAADLEMSPVVGGSFLSVFFVGYILANVGSGFLSDRLGARAVLSAALGLLGLFCFAFAQIGSIWQGLLVQFLMGLASGCFFSASACSVVGCFGSGERGRAFGLLAVPAAVGVAMANAVYPIMLDRIAWNTVYALVGVGCLVVAGACLLVLRPAQRRAETPGFATRRLIGGFGRDVRRSVLEMARAPDLKLLTLAGFGGTWASWGFAFWAPTLLIKTRGLSPTEAGSVVALFGVGALVAKPACGLISDLVGRRRIVAFASLGAFAALLGIFGAVQGLTAYLVLAPMLGFAGFGYSPLIGAMISERVPAERVGAATGFAHALAQCGNLAAPVAVAAVFQATGSLSASMLSLAAVAALAAATVMAVPRAKSAPVGGAPVSALEAGAVGRG